MPPSAPLRRLAALVAHQHPSVHTRRASTSAASATAGAFKIVFMEPGGVISGGRVELCATHVQKAYPADKVTVVLADSDAPETLAEVADADACYGFLSPPLLAAAPSLQWLQCPMAAPPSEYFFPELVASDVVVTNMRGIYDQELSIHMLTLMLAVNRQLGEYRDQQQVQKQYPCPPEPGIPHYLDTSDTSQGRF